MRGRLPGRPLTVLALSLTCAGCAFNNGIAVEVSGSSPVRVTESFSAQVGARHVAGVTTRARQVVRLDCAVTIVYDVNEATGSAVLAQSYVVHLRTPRLRRHVAYTIDCVDPLILELPADASSVTASATPPSGGRVQLSAPSAASVPLAKRRRLRAERGMQLVVIGWPATLAAGDYRLELDFDLPDAHAFAEKAVYGASVSCGRASYVQPILPSVTSFAHVPAFTVDPAAGPTTIILPHIAGANALHAEATHALSC